MSYPEDVKKQYEAVRRSGKTNMFDRQRVREIARNAGFGKLVQFIDDNDGAEYIRMAEQAADDYRGVHDGDVSDLEDQI